MSVTLNCTATSDGEITHWLQDGARIDAAADSGIEVTISGNGAGYSSTLTITSYETSRAGDYRCVARSMTDESFVEVSHGAILSHFSKYQSGLFCILYSIDSGIKLIMSCIDTYYMYCFCVLSHSHSILCVGMQPTGVCTG